MSDEIIDTPHGEFPQWRRSSGEGIEKCECGEWDEGECPNCNDSSSHTGPVEGNPPIDVKENPIRLLNRMIDEHVIAQVELIEVHLAQEKAEVRRLLKDNIRLQTTIDNLLESMEKMAKHTQIALEVLESKKGWWA